MNQETYGCVVITGANRGIGLEFVRHFGPVAGRLIATCRDPASATALRQLSEQMESIEIVGLDVTSADDIAALRSAVSADPVDVLINNAGVYGPRGMPVDKTAWHDVLEVNVMGPFEVSQALLDAVARSDRKLIANVTSKMGSIADNSSGGAYIYRTSKTALNQTMRSLAQDVRDRGVTVLLLHPGWVKTDMGGPNALIDTATSVAGMKRIIDAADPGKSGRFFDYDGSEIPW